MASPTELRDRLALDRTLLANERTLLAYVRTALALVGAGAALLHFFHEAASQIAGWALVVAGAVALVVGVIRYRAVHADVCRARDAVPPPR